MTISPTFAVDLMDRLTNNDQTVVQTNDIVDPLRDGANNPGQWVEGLYYNGKIFSFMQAQNETLAFIQRMVNWSLSVVGLVALIYLLYHGFLMVTAAGDDAQFKKGAKAARTAVTAIIWIWLSALIVNFILYIIGAII